jgi:2-desacetyl-2-hydroxyethyl bacteriochlorophyllide A dehydrogenase
MRQAIMLSPGVIEYHEVPEPGQLQEHEILLRIKKIGICGSDIHVWHGKHPATRYPVVQGHEYSAIVEAVGRSVVNVLPGMKATGRPQLVCGECGPCRRGQYNVCQKLKVEGFQAPGVARDLFVIPDDRIIALPDNMSFEEGALIEPVAVGAHSTGRASDLTGKNVVVSGAGTIGNLVAQYAKARGAGKILITDVSDYRLDISRQCGIEGILNINKTSFGEGVRSFFGNEGFQTGFEAAGIQGSLDVLIQHVEKGGEIIILGVYSANPVVNMFYLGEHELNLYGSMMYRHEDFVEAAAMISSGKIIVAPLLTKTFPFEDWTDAYKFIDQQGDKTMKVLIAL